MSFTIPFYEETLGYRNITSKHNSHFHLTHSMTNLDGALLTTLSVLKYSKATLYSKTVTGSEHIKRVQAALQFFDVVFSSPLF